MITKDYDGNEIKVGMVVGFKSDYEQSGRVIQISQDGRMLRLVNPDGFGGDYLRYATETWEDACRCWVEE